MNKPFVNLADVEFDDVEDNGYYTSRRATFSASIGAQKLGYNLTELPPGSADPMEDSSLWTKTST